MNHSTHALLAWVSQLTGRPVYSLNELSTGVHFCLLFNQMVKGRFAVHKINYEAKMQIQRISNLKRLIDGMKEHKINQSIDITKIAKESRQEILWTLQWFRKEIDKLGPEPERLSKEKEKEVKRYKVTYKGGNNEKAQTKPQIIKKEDSSLIPITKEYFDSLRKVDLIDLPCNEVFSRPYQTGTKVQRDQQHSVQFNQEIQYPSLTFQSRSALSENNSNIANVNTHISHNATTLEDKREQVEDCCSQKIHEFSLTNPFLKKSEQKPISQKRIVRFPLIEAICLQKDEASRSKEDRSISKKKSCLKSPNNSTKTLEAPNKSLKTEPSYWISNLQE